VQKDPDAGHRALGVETRQEPAVKLFLCYLVVTESVERLVKKAEMEDYGSSPRSATCGVLDCFSAREKRDSHAHKRASRRIGMKSSVAGGNADADECRR